LSGLSRTKYCFQQRGRVSMWRLAWASPGCSKAMSRYLPTGSAEHSRRGPTTTRGFGSSTAGPFSPSARPPPSSGSHTERSAATGSPAAVRRSTSSGAGCCTRVSTSRRGSRRGCDQDSLTPPDGVRPGRMNALNGFARTRSRNPGAGMIGSRQIFHVPPGHQRDRLNPDRGVFPWRRSTIQSGRPLRRTSRTRR